MTGRANAKVLFDLSITAFNFTELALMVSKGASDTKDTFPFSDERMEDWATVIKGFNHKKIETNRNDMMGFFITR